MAKNKKDTERKGKKAKKEVDKKTQMKAKKYSAEGDKVKRSRKFCPKCGPGVFLAEHQDRLSCGKCQYTEFKTAA